MAQPQPAQREPVPTRLSALYQYHNAPEVAPAHGLEYDDNHYPHSDKYPVLREMSVLSTKNGKFNYDGAPSKPPRIIFGMKIRTFLTVAAIMLVVILGAAIGGGVGGAHIQSGESNPGAAPMATSSSRPTATTAAPSIFSAPVPTYTPLSDCPASNNTRYVSALATDTKQPAPGLAFTRYCSKASPLNSVSSASNITQAFVYSFADCIEVCASYNLLHSNNNNTNTDCTVAVYQPVASRPVNCWVGNAGDALQVNTLAAAESVDIAVMTPQKQ